MKWNVKKLNANEFITIEGKNITTDGVEIEVADNNTRAIKCVKNTLSRLKRDRRIEVVSGDVPEKPESPFKKRAAQAQAQSEGQAPGAPARQRRALKEEQEQAEQSQEAKSEEGPKPQEEAGAEAAKEGKSEE
jgi:hypothetical protein|nr:MAG TPA: hypothetical protein [Caudoviricetes sp.]